MDHLQLATSVLDKENSRIVHKKDAETYLG